MFHWPSPGYLLTLRWCRPRIGHLLLIVVLSRERLAEVDIQAIGGETILLHFAGIFVQRKKSTFFSGIIKGAVVYVVRLYSFTPSCPMINAPSSFLCFSNHSLHFASNVLMSSSIAFLASFIFAKCTNLSRILLGAFAMRGGRQVDPIVMGCQQEVVNTCPP